MFLIVQFVHARQTLIGINFHEANLLCLLILCLYCCRVDMPRRNRSPTSWATPWKASSSAGEFLRKEFLHKPPLLTFACSSSFSFFSNLSRVGSPFSEHDHLCECSFDGSVAASWSFDEKPGGIRGFQHLVYVSVHQSCI